MTTTTSLFAKTVESLDASNENIRSLFGGTAVATSRQAAGVSQFGRAKWDGYVLEAERFVGDIIKGRQKLYLFAEAMSTALFPSLFADSLDRQLYGAYTAAPTSWSNYARRGTVNDFREVKRFAQTGIRGVLHKVPELSEHERRQTTEAEYKYSAEKYEAGFGMSFEAMINDDLGLFERLPQDLAQSARDSEEFFVTGLYAGVNGPSASVYTVGNDNIIASNAPLTRASLQGAITRLLKRKDERGNPITVTAVELVVGPGLQLTANEILDAKEYRAIDAAGNVTIIAGNGVAANLRVNTNFWLPAVATTANADTSWFLFASVSGTARPAMEVGFLRGYEAPALYERIPDMRRIGGGAEVPWSYDFGDQEKKIQHIFGGTFIDARMTLASNGTNTP
jgi:hypothetical protein